MKKKEKNIVTYVKSLSFIGEINNGNYVVFYIKLKILILKIK